MKKNIRVPGDPVLPGSLFSEDKFPGMHQGEHQILILTGPNRIFDSYQLGHIPADHMQFVLVRYEKAGITLKHAHPDQAQLYYVVAGRAKVMIDRSEIEMTPGTFASIPSYEPHGFRNEWDEPLLMLDVHSYSFENELPTTLSVEHVTLKPGEVLEHAGHSDREIAFFVTQGQGEAIVDSESGAVPQYSLIFVRRNMAYRLSNVAAIPFKLVAIASRYTTGAASTDSEPVPLITPLIENS